MFPISYDESIGDIWRGYLIQYFDSDYFHYENFCGIWFSLGYDKNTEDAIVLQIQFMWLQLIIGFDL